MKKGFGLIEIIIAASIITVLFVAILSTYSLFLKTLLGGTQDIKATYLLREGIEVVRIVRDNGWTTNIASLDVDTPYYPTWNGSTWTLSSTPNLIDGFYRKVIFETAYRDANDDLVSSGGAEDDNTRFVTTDVSWWNGSATTTKSVSTFITNIHSD